MRALNHVNLVVSDVERSASFYERIFGLERQWKEGDFVFLSCGQSDLGLVAGKPLSHRRFHIGFRLDERQELLDWHARLAETGVELDSDPRDYGDYYTFTCRDPDGYGIEIYVQTTGGGRIGYPPED